MEVYVNVLESHVNSFYYALAFANIQKLDTKKYVENKKKYSFVSAVIQDNKTQRGGKENEFFLSFFVE